MSKRIEVEPIFRLWVGDEEITLTKNELIHLRLNIDRILGRATSENDHGDEAFWALQDILEVPEGVPRDLNPFAMAMLSACIKYHNGYENRAKAAEIVEEIVQDYPEVAQFYESKGRMSYATIFTADNGKGSGLVPEGLLNMDKENGSRVYWVGDG